MSVVHVVLVQWDEQISASELKSASDTARLMASRIPGIQTIEEGPSVSPEGLEQGHNWALVVRFESADARDGYLPHPAHLELVEQIKAHALKVTVFDLATDD